MDEAILKIGGILKEREITRREFADWLVIGGTHVHGLFYSRRGWTPEMRRRAAEVLGMAEEELFPGDGWGKLIWLEVELLQRGLGSKSWLAQKIGISPGDLSRLLNGLNKWTRSKRQAASEALGIPEDQLFAVVEVQSGRQDSAGTG